MKTDDLDLQEIRALASRIVAMIEPSVPEIDYRFFTPLPEETLTDWEKYDYVC